VRQEDSKSFGILDGLVQGLLEFAVQGIGALLEGLGGLLDGL
jgi:hypothetical protein